MNKIQKTSLFFRVLFQVLCVALPVLLIMAWVQSAGTFEMVEGVINLNYVPAAYSGSILHPLDLSEKTVSIRRWLPSTICSTVYSFFASSII